MDVVESQALYVGHDRGVSREGLGAGIDMIAWCPGTLNDHSGRRCGTDGGEQGWGVKIRKAVSREGDVKSWGKVGALDTEDVTRTLQHLGTHQTWLVAWLPWEHLAHLEVTSLASSVSQNITENQRSRQRAQTGDSEFG